MQRFARRSRFVAAVAAMALGTSLVTATSGGAPGANAIPADRAPAGPSGPAITVENQAQLSGYDLATDPTTNIAYLGWISSQPVSGTPAAVHLCVLPPGATSCAGGVLTTSAIDSPSAAGMQVEVTGPGVVTLIWFHQSGLTTGKLATATYANGVLGPAADVADAPSNGVLFDVARGPDGQLWALTQSDSGNAHQLQVRQGLAGIPQGFSAPWAVGHASLAIAGSKAVVTAAEAGAISTPVHSSSGPPFAPFQPIGKTWSLGLFSDVVTTSHGVRMIASENNAGYRPVVARWKGSSFTAGRLIGENQSCPALTHDLVTDGSGRLANVSERCGKIGIYNLPNTKNAAIKRFGAGGTLSGGAPQITTTTRGHGWVAWGILDSPVGTKLLVRPVRLPALLSAKSKQEKGNKVTIKGPVSCLPVVHVFARMKTNPAPGWNLVNRHLKLDGDNVSSPVKIDGAKLPEGSKHELVGKAVFRKGNQTVEVKKTFKFTVC